MRKNVVSISKRVLGWQQDCKLKSLKGESLFLNFSYKCKRHTESAHIMNMFLMNFLKLSILISLAPRSRYRMFPAPQKHPHVQKRTVFFF